MATSCGHGASAHGSSGRAAGLAPSHSGASWAEVEAELAARGESGESGEYKKGL